nr:UvrD-helicase domain-containing protein [Phycisphaerae bacterium]
MAHAPIRHARILASAGSGKTFRLSGRAIELIRRGVPPASILASTFTRAAAAEIRDRVLGRLAAAVLDSDDRARLAIGSPLPAPDEAEAVALLECTVRALDKLQIRTLDSLFASTVMAFAAELGLPPEPRVLDAHEAALLADIAIARMLASGDADALLATVAALNKGQQRLSVAGAIRGAIERAVDIFRESEPGAWEWEERPLASAEDVDAMIADAAALQPRDLAIAKALTAMLEALRGAGPHDPDAWCVVLAKGLGPKIVDGSYVFYKKPIPSDVIAAVEPLTCHALDLNYREIVRRTKATHDLAARFHAAYSEVKREAAVVTFADLTHAIAESTMDPDRELDLADVFFRLDATFQHALLDEFQDTSVVQWRALLPMVRELASGNPDQRSLFVVGDLKQSIYGWRGASPQLLQDLPDLILESGTLDLDNEHLSKSFRSSQCVLDAVDSVFSTIDVNDAIGDHVAAARAWKRAWSAHTANQPDLEGVVELHIAPSAGGRNDCAAQQAMTLDTAANLVADIRALAPSISIGVLCRRNAAVAGLLNRLRQRGVAASARGVGSLQDAAAVNAVLDALQFADHPDHTAACFHVTHSPLGPILGIAQDAQRGEHWSSRQSASARIRSTLDRLGYAETIRRWRDELGDAVDVRESRRLDELIDAASQFDAADAVARRPAEVVAALRALAVDEPGGSGVTVMNIHQSKGLEFDAVVLCDIDRAFQPRMKIAAVRARADGQFCRVVRWPGAKVRDAVFDPLVNAVTEDAYREHLSLLYVAMTRARQGLFVVSGPCATKAGVSLSNSFAGIIRWAWCPNAMTTGIAYQCGSRVALGSTRNESPHAMPAVPERAEPIRLSPPAGLRVVRALSASERGHPVGFPQDDRAASDTARLRGLVLHAMLETIEFLPERPDLDTFVAGFVEAGQLAVRRARAQFGGVARVATDAAAEAWCRELAGWLRERLDRPALQQVLARPAGEATVHRERRFVRLVEIGLESSVVDRLVLIGAPERPTAAQIIDYKTDSVTPGGGAALLERYRPQLAAYMEAVAERYRLDPRAVQATLVLLDSGEVVS